MAADEALLERVVRSGGAFLRLYRWDPPTLSIGRNQQGVFENTPVVRRPTGGQAVWHEHEVTYAVAAHIARYGSLRKAYCDIHTSIATALRSLGVDAALAPAVRPRPSGSPLGSDGPTSCFALPVGGEIVVGGKKLVGSAQVRKRDAFLQHGSILLDVAPAQSFNGGTTLAEVLGRNVTFGEVVDALRPSLIASLGP